MGLINIECMLLEIVQKGSTKLCKYRSIIPASFTLYTESKNVSSVFVTAPSSCTVCVSLQTGRTVQEEPLPTLSYLVIWMLGLALVALIVLGTVCVWKRKEMSKCVTRSSKSRQSSSGSVSRRLNLRGTLVRVGCSPELIYVC
jgi:hypothetical protein